MTVKYPHLFSPITIKGVRFKNRVGMSPQSTPDDAVGGHVSERGRVYYETRARGGAGVITVGETPVDFDYAAKDPAFLRLGYKEINTHDMAELRILTDSIKRHGAVASIELAHVGAMNLPFTLNGRNPIGPSDFDSPVGLHAVAMTEAQIFEVAENFAAAAEYCKRVGFDMCMVHGGHGWLLAQFLSPLFNRRADSYGGSLENRARFPLMVLDRIREKCGPDFLIELRISADEELEGGCTQGEMLEFCKMAEDKVDILHCSVGTPLDPNNRTFSSIYDPNGRNVHLSEAVKKAVKIPVATIGGINDAELAERIVAEGKADFVYLGRQMVADPEFANKCLDGKADVIMPCIRCMCCHAAPAPPTYLECTVNPVATREYYFGALGRCKKARRVYVAGGGPAGMTAAAVAAERGHDVTLFEKSDSLGGIIKFTDFDVHKGDLRKLKNALIARTEASGARILLDTELTPEMLAAGDPDVLCMAVGSVRATPPIPGIDSAMHVLDAYYHPERIGRRVAVIGGGLAGCEAALHLAALGKDVTVLEMLPELARDSYPYHRNWMLHRLEQYVKCRTGVKCTGVAPGGVTILDGDAEVMVPADTVVYGVGMKSVSPAAFERAFSGIYAQIGDCVRPAKLKEAIHGGYFAAADW